MELVYGSAYGERRVMLLQYDTAKEKSLLMLGESKYVDYNCLDFALKIIGYDEVFIDTLTRFEKRLILLKCREISVGSSIAFNYTCSNCKNINSSNLDIDNTYVNRLERDGYDYGKRVSGIKEAFLNINEDDSVLNQYITEPSDDMDMLEYENIISEITNGTMDFATSVYVTCSTCNHDTKIKIDDKFIVDNLSEDSVASIYQTYSDLIYHGKYSKLDVDSLLAFERTIFVSMLNAAKNA